MAHKGGEASGIDWGSLPNTLTTKGTKGHEGLTAEIAEVFVESAEQSVHLEGR